MKGAYDRISRYDHRGICSACDHVATCRLHSEYDEPVFFCEEFTGVSIGSADERAGTSAISGSYEHQIAVRKPECARLAYLGLCRNCEKIITCPFLKPGGGTWQCDSYEERTSI